MHVLAHVDGRLQHLLGRQTTIHHKRLVHLHQGLDPRIDEQVVANGNLHCCGETILQQEGVEKCRIEHNVTMVGHEGVVSIPVKCLRKEETIACSRLVQHIIHQGLHKSYLEVERCLDALKHQSQNPVPQTLGQGNQTLKNLVELAICQHALEGWLHLTFGIRTNIIKIT